VEKYFDYWEKYAQTRPVIGTVAAGDVYGAIEKLRRIHGHYLAYPPQVFGPAEAILDKAMEAAKKDPLAEFAQRVAFLQAGLKHAKLTLHLQDFIDYDSPVAEVGSAPVNNPQKLKKAREAMAQLMKFRLDPKNLFVSDYISNTATEQSLIRNFEVLYKGNTPAKAFERPDEVY
jgi:hypothetical protein